MYVLPFDSTAIENNDIQFPMTQEELEAQLDESTQEAYEVQDFTYTEEENGLQSCYYVLVPAEGSEDTTYGVSYLIMNANNEGYQIAAQVQDEASVDLVKSIMDSFDAEDALLSAEEAEETEAVTTETDTETTVDTETETSEAADTEETAAETEADTESVSEEESETDADTEA